MIINKPDKERAEKGGEAREGAEAEPKAKKIAERDKGEEVRQEEEKGWKEGLFCKSERVEKALEGKGGWLHPRVWKAETAEGLRRIGEEGIDMVVWEREVEEALEGYISLFEREKEDRIYRAKKAEEFEAFFQEKKQKDPLGYRAFVKDIEAIVGWFLKITDDPEPRLRLDRVQSNGCRRFHVDSVVYRMLCTYLGPGTEWVSAEDLDRECSCPLDHVKPSKIRRLSRFSVAILKGKKKGGERQIYHRSPPIEGTGEHRLLLCLDSLKGEED